MKIVSKEEGQAEVEEASSNEDAPQVEEPFDEDEKEHVWDFLRFKHKRDCCISSEPSDILYSRTTTDFNNHTESMQLQV